MAIQIHQPNLTLKDVLQEYKLIIKQNITSLFSGFNTLSILSIISIWILHIAKVGSKVINLRSSVFSKKSLTLFRVENDQYLCLKIILLWE